MQIRKSARNIILNVIGAYLGRNIERQSDDIDEVRKKVASLKSDKSVFEKKEAMGNIHLLTEGTISTGLKLQSLVGKIADEIRLNAVSMSETWGKNNERFDELVEEITSLMEKASESLESSSRYKTSSEKMLLESSKVMKETEDKTKLVGEAERKLRIREEMATHKLKMAQTQLQRAKELVYWKDKPGTYT